MNWIDATKSLPKISRHVLVCNERGSVYISFILMQDELGNFIWFSQHDNEYEEVTHWMELPEPPIQDSEIVLVTSKDDMAGFDIFCTECGTRDNLVLREGVLMCAVCNPVEKEEMDKENGLA